MRIIDEKFIIRDLSLKDADDYYEYAKNPDVGPNAGWKPVPNLQVARQVLSGHIFSKDVFAIALRDSNKLIGTISLYNYGIRKYNKTKSLGFSLSKDYWNMGIMTRAVKLMVDYTFQKTDCEVLEVGHHVGNIGSKRVIEKNGFIFDGRLCKYKRLYDGRLIDADFYSMTREDYERKKKYE